MNFREVLVLPKTVGSAQTHKSMSFIWIVWSTLYVYICWFTEQSCIIPFFPQQITVTSMRKNPDYSIYYNCWARLFFLGVIPAAMLIYLNYKVSFVPLVFCYQNCSDLLWEKIVLVIEENFWNSRLKAENLQNFWDHWNNLFKQWKVRTIFGNRMLF